VLGAIQGISLYIAIIVGIPIGAFVLEQFIRGLGRDKRRRAHGRFTRARVNQ